MITVEQIDRLLVSTEATAARLWPRLGPRVRQAYTADRDRWALLRRKSGQAIPSATLTSEHKVFSGWARAFSAAAGRRRPVASAPTRATAAVSPAVAAAPPKTKGSGALIAGGILIAGVVAFAAGRKRA